MLNMNQDKQARILGLQNDRICCYTRAGHILLSIGVHISYCQDCPASEICMILRASLDPCQIFGQKIAPLYQQSFTSTALQYHDLDVHAIAYNLEVSVKINLRTKPISMWCDLKTVHKCGILVLYASPTSNIPLSALLTYIHTHHLQPVCSNVILYKTKKK